MNYVDIQANDVEMHDDLVIIYLSMLHVTCNLFMKKYTYYKMLTCNLILKFTCTLGLVAYQHK